MYIYINWRRTVLTARLSAQQIPVVKSGRRDELTREEGEETFSVSEVDPGTRCQVDATVLARHLRRVVGIWYAGRSRCPDGYVPGVNTGSYKKVRQRSLFKVESHDNHRLYINILIIKLLYICTYSILILVLWLFSFISILLVNQLPYTKVRIICIY